MSTSRSLNKVMLIGNITRDPALRETPNGGLVSTFGIATNASWKDADGNIQERTEFHNVVAWNKLAEITAQILATGMLVYIEGELRTRTWEDGNGVRHYRTEIKIDDLKLLDKKGREPIGLDKSKEQGTKAEGEDTMEAAPAEVKEVAPVAEEPKDEDLSKEAEELF
jgi:single-strand DNA-binding protein